MYAPATCFTTFSFFPSTADFMSGVHYYDDVEMEDVFAVAMDVNNVEMEDAKDNIMGVSMW